MTNYPIEILENQIRNLEEMQADKMAKREQTSVSIHFFTERILDLKRAVAVLSEQDFEKVVPTAEQEVEVSVRKALDKLVGRIKENFPFIQGTNQKSWYEYHAAQSIISFIHKALNEEVLSIEPGPYDPEKHHAAQANALCWKILTTEKIMKLIDAEGKLHPRDRERIDREISKLVEITMAWGHSLT